MMVLLVSGVMDIGVMAKFAAYASGGVISVAGALIIARALGDWTTPSFIEPRR